jgi:hypothetical protein
LVCGCVNRARQFTPLARVIFWKTSEQNVHDAGLDKHCTLLTCEGDWLRGGAKSNWPSGTHHVDDGVWNAWVYACANHTRPTRGTRRELGSDVNRNEELVNIYRQTPHKSPHEVSRIRWVLLGTAAQRFRNICKLN